MIFSGKTRRVVGILLALMMLFALTGSAMAATGASNSYSVAKSKGSTGDTYTFSVTTNADWKKFGGESITFGQNKGVREVRVPFSFPIKYKKENQYTKLDITATPSGGGATKTAKLTGSSVKLNLDTNKTYTVTVSWSGFDQTDKGIWLTYPTWKINSTTKCTYTTPQ